MADNKQETPFTNNLFSNHFLEERLTELEDWQEAEIEEEFEKIRELWQEKEQYLQTEPNEDNTQDEWINEVLKIIGHKQWSAEPTKTIGNDRNLNPDYVFFEDFQTRMDASETENEFEQGYVIGEAKKWNRNLDKSTDDHTNPAFQIYNYVDRLRVPWGILTNGRKWRLYSYEDCEADTYYQIDIVSQILKKDDRETALQNFKYFYLFFRKESFLPKEEGFLDKVFEGSVSYSKGLEEDLEDKIYTALEKTARGFFDTNDIEKTEENVETVHRASLIFLYRFLFILNAESRGLLPIEEDRYEKILSLEYLKQRLDEGDTEVFNDDEWVWNRRIQPLFEAINQGEQYGEFEITAYNGGLFDEEKHEFLADHKLKGTYVREVLKLLAQSEDAETGEKVLVDYRDLNIRHLGSVYEGLLEHDLEVAEERLILKKGEWEEASGSSKDFDEVEDDRKVEKGQVYLTNESGERKATGSYYTPEYIVEYIVENTVGPKVEEKIEEADNDSEVMDEVLELDVCDPAMGSGHFLTEATSFIAHRIVEHGDIDEERVDEGNELVWVKRKVVKRCIYGVDINPLATELAKLSLWIETMSEGKPLSFLDHHLKVGNSLIGTDIEKIKVHPEQDLREKEDLSEFNDSIKNAKKVLEEEYGKIERKEEETVEQVHEKEEMYRDFLNSNLYRNLHRVADVYTHQYFDGELSPEDYNRFIGFTFEDMRQFKDEKWFQNAQKDANQRHYFHWELEFPKIFFGKNEGFDAVVGNPPYIRQENLGQVMKDYLKENFEVYTSKADLSTYFFERGIDINSNTGYFAYISSNKFMFADYGDALRRYLAKKGVQRIVNFEDLPVFEDATTYPAIFIINGAYNGQTEYARIPDLDFRKLANSVESNSYLIFEGGIDGEEWYLRSEEKHDLMRKIENKGTKLEDYIGDHEIKRGILTGLNEAFVIDEEKRKELIKEDPDSKEIIKPFISGKEVRRFGVESKNKYLIWTYNGVPIDDYPAIRNHLEEFKDDLEDRWDKGDHWYELRDCSYYDEFEENKIIYPEVSSRARFTLDEEGYFLNKTVFEIPVDDKALTGILNSKLLEMYLHEISSRMRGGYYMNSAVYINQLPISQEIDEQLASLSSEQIDRKRKLNKLNLSIEDYLGNYSDGKTLNNLYTPPSGISDKPVSKTADDLENLQVGSVETEKDGDSITLLVSARYKPENEAGHETNQYGYTETELYPAMEFHNLSKTEAALIEEFVPVAVDEAGGFADFRESATKTMSLIDRLKKLRLPKVSDVEDDLQKFIEQKEKAEQLEEEIEETDQEINEIVYDLYDLTEEEIEIVEESVNES